MKILEFEERAVLVLGERTAGFFLKKITYSDGCWHWIGSKNKSGHGRFWADGKMQIASRVSFLIANGEWPEEEALHTCDNPGCVNPNELYDGTDQDNMKDRKKSGHYGKNIKAADVHEIKKMIKAGVKQTEIADMFGVSKMSISDIKLGRRWKEVE